MAARYSTTSWQPQDPAARVASFRGWPTGRGTRSVSRAGPDSTAHSGLPSTWLAPKLAFESRCNA